MKLSSLLAAKKRVEVTFGDQVFTIHYLPAVYSRQFIIDSMETPTAEALAQILGDWDLEDDDSKALPLNAETLKGLPEPVMGAILTAVQNDAFPNP